MKNKFIKDLNSNLPVLAKFTIKSSIPVVAFWKMLCAYLAALVASLTYSSNADFQPYSKLRLATLFFSNCVFSSSLPLMASS
jgi:hypothetical protein